MKKRVLIAIVSAIVLIIATGCLYYYFYIDTVSNYFLVKYIPPQPRESMFGGYEESDPKFDFSQLKDYENDSIAVEAQTKEAKHSYSYFENEYEKELRQPKEENPIIQDARMKAIISKLMEERYLIRITHIRKFSAEEALKMIQKHWADESLKDYAKSNKIEVEVYLIPNI